MTVPMLAHDSTISRLRGSALLNPQLSVQFEKGGPALADPRVGSGDGPAWRGAGEADDPGRAPRVRCALEACEVEVEGRLGFRVELERGHALRSVVHRGERLSSAPAAPAAGAAGGQGFGAVASTGHRPSNGKFQPLTRTSQGCVAGTTNNFWQRLVGPARSAGRLHVVVRRRSASRGAADRLLIHRV
jgi:hypothetical protein